MQAETLIDSEDDELLGGIRGQGGWKETRRTGLSRDAC
jgi:hypothetical protein